MLKLQSEWRFNSPGSMAIEAVNEFDVLVHKVASQGQQWGMLEHFKSYFSKAVGLTASISSSESWAASDLDNYMTQAAENAPLFIAAFYDACVAAQEGDPEISIPDVSVINRLLAKHAVGYELRPPQLLSLDPQQTIPVQEQAPSLDEQAQETIRQSLRQADLLLAEGRPRQAVQEVLWLLETVSTAFQGCATGSVTVQGKYFNKIIEDLRLGTRGKSIHQILGWVTTLHGYLSSPTGGGVRHGSHLASAVTLDEGEARLYCNLTRSYIAFLLAEHARLNKES